MNSIVNRPVFLFIRVFSKYGGVESVCFRFYNFLKLKNVPVKVVCGENKTDIKSNDIIITGLWHPGRLFKGLSFNIKSKKLVTEFYAKGVTFSFDKVDGCHIYRTGGASHLDYLLTSLKGYTGLSAKVRKAGERLINPVNYYYVYLENKIFKNKKMIKIIAISDNSRKELIKRFRYEDKKIEVIHNGVDKKKFSLDEKTRLKAISKEKYKLPNNKKIIGF